MKHKWIIKPRGLKSKAKYYTCSRCLLTIVALSKAEADESRPKCLAQYGLEVKGGFDE